MNYVIVASAMLAPAMAAQSVSAQEASPPQSAAPVVAPAPSTPAPPVNIAKVPTEFVPAKGVAPAGAKPFLVGLTGMVMLPPEKPNEIGSEWTIKEHDVVFKTRLGWFQSASAEKDISVNIAGLVWTIPKGTLIQRAYRASGGDLAEIKQAAVYCDVVRNDATKGMLNALTLGLSQIGKRVEKQSQLCVLDSNEDGMFDKAFLVGLKKPEDRFVVDIPHVTYQSFANKPLGEDSYIQVTYYDGGMLSGPNFGLGVWVNGQKLGIQAVRMALPIGNRALPIQVPVSSSIKLKELPQTIRFGMASITVTGFDATAKTANIAYKSEWRWAPIGLVYPPQTIYIYY